MQVFNIQICVEIVKLILIFVLKANGGVASSPISTVSTEALVSRGSTVTTVALLLVVFNPPLLFPIQLARVKVFLRHHKITQ